MFTKARADASKPTTTAAYVQQVRQQQKAAAAAVDPPADAAGGEQPVGPLARGLIKAKAKAAAAAKRPVMGPYVHPQPHPTAAAAQQQRLPAATAAAVSAAAALPSPGPHPHDAAPSAPPLPASVKAHKPPRPAPPSPSPSPPSTPPPAHPAKERPSPAAAPSPPPPPPPPPPYSSLHPTPTSPPSSASPDASLYSSPATSFSDCPEPVPSTPELVGHMKIFPELTRLLDAARNCQLPASHAAPVPGEPGYPSQLLSVSTLLPGSMRRAAWSMADFEVQKTLYKGYASTVFRATCRRSGSVVVLKVYNVDAVCELFKYQVFREVHLHSRAQHRNIVVLHAAFMEGQQVVLVEEYADGRDLYAVLNRHHQQRMSERAAVQVVLEPFLRVLHYLHSQGVVHRDIKPENILFTKDMVLKLADFGLAVNLNEERAVTRAGTLHYMAPEVLRCPNKLHPLDNKSKTRHHYTGAVDAWAVGILTYELLTGVPPFYGGKDQSRGTTEELIMTSRPSLPASLSSEARDFIGAALSHDAGRRMTVAQMLQHPWVQTYCAPGTDRLQAAAAAPPTPGTKRPAPRPKVAGVDAGDGAAAPLSDEPRSLFAPSPHVVMAAAAALVDNAPQAAAAAPPPLQRQQTPPAEPKRASPRPTPSPQAKQAAASPRAQREAPATPVAAAASPQQQKQPASPAKAPATPSAAAPAPRASTPWQPARPAAAASPAAAEPRARVQPPAVPLPNLPDLPFCADEEKAPRATREGQGVSAAPNKVYVYRQGTGRDKEAGGMSAAEHLLGGKTNLADYLKEQTDKLRRRQQRKEQEQAEQAGGQPRQSLLELALAAKAAAARVAAASAAVRGRAAPNPHEAYTNSAIDAIVSTLAAAESTFVAADGTVVMNVVLPPGVSGVKLEMPPVTETKLRTQAALANAMQAAQMDPTTAAAVKGMLDRALGL